MSEERFFALISDLLRQPGETPWVEFKENNCEAVMVGKRISALANAARLADKPFGYLPSRTPHSR